MSGHGTRALVGGRANPQQPGREETGPHSLHLYSSLLAQSDQSPGAGSLQTQRIQGLQQRAGWTRAQVQGTPNHQVPEAPPEDSNGPSPARPASAPGRGSETLLNRILRPPQARLSPLVSGFVLEANSTHAPYTSKHYLRRKTETTASCPTPPSPSNPAP